MDARFEELLLAYTQADPSPEARHEVEARLWREFGRTRAVLVMDMSGFSLLTQKYGVVHYLSMVKRMQLATRPVIERHGGEVVKFEADNCFAAFEAVLPAARAAIELGDTFERMNHGADDSFDIRVSVGIDHGDVLMIGGPDYFGDPVNRASKLGEDVAGPGEIYLTARAFAQLPPEAGLRGTPLALSLSGIELEAYVLQHRAPR